MSFMKLSRDNIQLCNFISSDHNTEDLKVYKELKELGLMFYNACFSQKRRKFNEQFCWIFGE